MKIKRKILGLVMICSLVVSNIGHTPSVNAAGENLTIFPESIEVNVNEDNFLASVYVDNISDLRRLEFTVHYDSPVVNYIGFDDDDIGSFAKNFCSSYYFEDNKGESEVRIIIYRSISCGGIEIVESTKVVDLHFRSLENVDTSNLSFSSLMALDSNDVEISDLSTGNAQVFVQDIDTTAPMITNTIATEIITEGDTYTNIEALAGVSATDDTDGDITGNIVVTNPVDVNTPGEYVVRYNISDSAGNPATEVTRTVTVEAVVTTPEVTILPNPDTVTLGDVSSLTISVSDVSDLAYFEVDLEYEETILSYDSLIFGAGVESNFWYTEVDDSVPGVLTVIADFDYNNTLDGDVEIVTIDFTTIATGTSDIAFAFSDIADSNFDPIIANWNDGLLTVNPAPIPDIEAPVRSAKSPSGSLSAGTTNTEISLVTDENAICKYSTVTDTSFASSTNTFSTTGSTTHSTLVSGLSNGNTYNYYIRCEDASSNENTDDYVITFSVASPAPSSSGGGGGGYVSPVDTTAPGQITDLKMEREGESVSLTWKNPSDSDFAGVLVVRSETELYSYTEQSSAKQIGTEIYQGKNEAYTDSISENLEYYYLLYTFDNNNNYSKAMVLKTSPVPTNTDNEGSQSNNESEQSQTSSAKYKSLAGVSSQIVEEVSRSEAGFVYRFNSFVDLDELHRNLYNRVVKESDTYLNDESKYSIAFFIRYGTDTTLVLGAGERAGVINSYKSVFNRLPQTEEEWSDVVKIANGRWPSERNMTAEQKAQSELFRTIYKREANMNNANDNAAVTVITYGLRPADRNMDSEKAGIKIFEGIFGYKPSSAIDWDIVRAISYSGAIR